MRLENKSGRVGWDKEKRKERRDETYNNAGVKAPPTSSLHTALSFFTGEPSKRDVDKCPRRSVHEFNGLKTNQQQISEINVSQSTSPGKPTGNEPLITHTRTQTHEHTPYRHTHTQNSSSIPEGFMSCLLNKHI